MFTFLILLSANRCTISRNERGIRAQKLIQRSFHKNSQSRWLAANRGSSARKLFRSQASVGSVRPHCSSTNTNFHQRQDPRTCHHSQLATNHATSKDEYFVFQLLTLKFRLLRFAEAAWGAEGRTYCCRGRRPELVCARGGTCPRPSRRCRATVSRRRQTSAPPRCRTSAATPAMGRKRNVGNATERHC